MENPDALTEIGCAECGGTQHIYRQVMNTSIGIPIRCKTRHQCRRLAHKVLDATTELRAATFHKILYLGSPITDQWRLEFNNWLHAVADSPHDPIDAIYRRIVSGRFNKHLNQWLTVRELTRKLQEENE